jgi:peptidoglycan hydrolase-like protein with peptidoglycan-binding domain
MRKTMRTILLILTAVLSLWLPLHAAQAKTPAKSTAAKKPAANTKKPAAKKTAAKKPPAKKAPAKSVAQQQPTRERYTEIQQALVERGYLEAADGTWGTSSVDALKKFQAEHALPVDGKLGALTLTAMGLGPRRGAFVVAPQVIASTVTAVE